MQNLGHQCHDGVLLALEIARAADILKFWLECDSKVVVYLVTSGVKAYLNTL